jgi:hypothetical protein
MKNVDIAAVLEVSLSTQDNPPPPYYKIAVDVLSCVDCSNKVFAPALAPLTEHYEENYSDIPAKYEARLRG